MDIGYTKNLYILPFDHRNTFAKKMYNTDLLSAEQEAQIREFKQLIYAAFTMSIQKGVPKENAAILVDEQYGAEVLIQAKQEGIVVLYTLEKSGTKNLEMDYQNWQEHVDKLKPQFCKVLVRYNTEDPQQERQQKLQTLKMVSDYCHQNNCKFLLEPLVPATENQFSALQNNQEAYDSTVRPNLTVTMIREMQEAQIEVDVWKLEGFEAREDYENVVVQARSGGRSHVGVVVLGRGAGTEKVEEWLKTGSQVDGVIGFAVGRTVFWQALDDYRLKKISREQAVEQICNNFLHFYNVYVQALN